MTDTELLREKIDNSGYRFNWIAKQLNLTPYGLRKKINGETEFKATEIVKFQEILKISKNYKFNEYKKEDYETKIKKI